MALNESQKYLFLALEMGVDRAFRSVGESSNFAQFGAFIPVSHKDLFGSLEQKRPCFLSSEFVLVYFWGHHLSRLYLSLSQRTPRHNPRSGRSAERRELVGGLMRPPSIDNPSRRINAGEQIPSSLLHWLSRIPF